MNPRQVGDAATDALVAELGGGIGLGFLCRLPDNAAALDPVAPLALADWYERARQLPEWARPERIRRAQIWAERHLALLVAGLFCSALPSAYAASRGARVVYDSGRLRTDIDKRIHRTGVFVLDVVRPGGLEPTGQAIATTCLVRYIHALVRSRMRAGHDEVPVNQEDMLGTLYTFSVQLVDALRKMGVHVSRSDDDDFFHLWRVVGALLGIEEARLPLNAAAARAAATTLAAREMRASSHGRELADVLFERIADHVPTTYGRQLPRTLSTYLLDRPAREALGLGAEPSWTRALPFGGLELRLAGQGAALLARRLGGPLVEMVLALKLAEHAPSLPSEPGAAGASHRYTAWSQNARCTKPGTVRPAAPWAARCRPAIADRGGTSTTAERS